jgi:hypothetical protein
MTDDVLVCLRDIRALLDDQGHWTKKAVARDEYGYSVEYFDPRAVSWCLLGAVWSRSLFPVATEAALRSAAESRGWRILMDANDDGGHAEVLAILDAAIGSRDG